MNPELLAQLRGILRQPADETVVRSAPSRRVAVARREMPLSEVGLADAPERTRLNRLQERAFQEWYGTWANKAGLDPNPDNPAHQYDYRGAFLAGDTPRIDSSDSLYHWPSAFKDADHPNRYVKGVGDSRSLDRAGRTKP